MVSKRRRPPRLSGGGLGDPRAKEAPSPQRRGPRRPRSQGGPPASAAGPGWAQSQGGPLASAAGASVIPKRKRPPRLGGASAAGASVFPKRQRPPHLSGGGLGGPKAEETPSRQRRRPPRRPRWSQRARSPLASAGGASVIPERRRSPRLSGGDLGVPKATKAPSPQRRGPP